MIFFYFLKIIFDINISKRFKIHKSYLILIKKNSKYLETQPQPGSRHSHNRLVGAITADGREMIIPPADHEHRDNIRKAISIGLTLR
jgi:hypothetical protein